MHERLINLFDERRADELEAGRGLHPSPLELATSSSPFAQAELDPPASPLRTDLPGRDSPFAAEGLELADGPWTTGKRRTTASGRETWKATRERGEEEDPRESKGRKATQEQQQGRGGQMTF